MKTTFDRLEIGSFFVFAKCDSSPDGSVHKKIDAMTGEDYQGFRSTSETSPVFTVKDYARPSNAQFSCGVEQGRADSEALRDRPIEIYGFDERVRFNIREATDLISVLASAVEIASRGK